MRVTARHFLLLFIFLIGFINNGTAEYQFTNEPIDVVIPCIKKDLAILELCIEGIKKNGVDVRRVIVISPEKLTDSAEWFEESKFPFTIADIAYYLVQEDAEKAKKFLEEPESRAGWYYQQLLKLYAPLIIPDISSNVLILDADTVFLNKVAFTNSNNAGLYNPGQEYHENYFKHADKLTNGSVKKLYSEYSGISHHMLFQRPVLEDFINTVESIHRKEFWIAFCSCVDPSDLKYSGASEYELYFNFVLSKSNLVEIRKLKNINISNLKKMRKYKKIGYHYISCHSYSRA